MNIDFPMPKIDVKAVVAVTAKPGAVDLGGYPLLVYAPGQHGDGIRTEDNGTPVSDLAARACEFPDADALAARFGTTPGHVTQALAYVAACLPREKGQPDDAL